MKKNLDKATRKACRRYYWNRQLVEGSISLSIALVLGLIIYFTDKRD